MSTVNTTTQKLTKKQKKSLAFRDRKSGKKSSSSTDTTTAIANSTTNSTKDADFLAMDDNAIPAMDDEDIAGLECDRMEVEGDEDEKGSKKGGKKGASDGKGKGKGKVAVRAEETGDAVLVAKTSTTGKGKKRKREEGDIDGEEKDGGEDGMDVDGEGEKRAKKKAKGDKTQRFILFVGNLKYTTTKEAIQAHFAAVCDPPPTVRLLTPKAKPGVAARPKSKGCAFLEFETKAPLQQALKLHHSMLESRMINVELTAGGGGKSEARLNKLRERNKALLGQRQKKVDKGTKGSIPSQPDKPQRYSATSGIDQAPTTKRTWSVGDTVEETTNRGGKRKQRGNRKPKSLGTGVNAIPVG
ncbi:RNA binding protein [Coprinopsis cinerea okayama7|uniref:RNA binding protein n=1 Tax=Coprinopsis cinerea (strain Okayama-7 / 130 / ATCC MYA-4618 / FGSC 9003) TaxID=240176 RepID=A8N2N8_COPC7|nr:RNA binding protein [Coprinopsis cinerea okayama7\|eukprot:XP_001829106.1 RNA binding protein [Coprinopsis cinerea okayama7\